MNKSALRFIAVLAMFLLAGLVRAESLPDRQPVLRIEAGAHLSAIKRISVSADETLLATASDDKTARLWNLATGQLIRTFRVPLGSGNGGKLHAAALSPDGSLLVAGGWDAHGGPPGELEHFVYVYSTIDGRMLKRLGPLPDVILDLAFSRDGQWLATGLGYGGVRLWAADGSQPTRSDTAYKGSVYSIDFDRNNRLVAAGMDGRIRLYAPPVVGVSRLRPVKSATTQDGSKPVSVAFSPDGTRIAVDYVDSTAISILETETLKPVKGRRVDTDFLGQRGNYALAWSADGLTLYAAGNYESDKAIQIALWDEGGFGAPRIVGGPIDAILDLASLPSGGVAWSAFDAEFGFFGGAQGSGGHRRPVNADFRAKNGSAFMIAPDASGVRIGLSYGDADPWQIDVPTLRFDAAPAAPVNWLQPLTDRLTAEGWMNGDAPAVNGRRLQLRNNEISRSLAMTEDGLGYFLGTDFSIYRIDASGKILWRREPPATAWGVNVSADGTIVVAALGDGTVRWYRAEDGAELLAFFANVPDKRWVLWTPSGYYAASPGGEDLIGWHVNGEDWDSPVDFFPASRFRDRFYRPDIVQLILPTRDEKAAIAAANAVAQRQTQDDRLSENELPAVITIAGDLRGIETNEREIDLRYTLRAPSQRKVTRIELRIDGQLVQTVDPRGFSEETPPEDGSLVMRVPIPQHDCVVTLVAFHGQQASAPATVQVRWTGSSAPPAARRLYALLVGVSQYGNPDLSLRYAAKDASDVAAALALQKGKFFSEVITVLLLNRDATKDAIDAALSDIRNRGGPDDYTLVFLAGHGTTVRNKFYFLPNDSEIAEGRIPDTALGDDHLAAELGAMKGKVLLFVDACYSARALRFDIPGLVNAITGEQNAVMMYSSSSGNEVSFEGAEWENGAFTEALLAILADPLSYDENQEIITDQLAVALRRKVSALTGGRQTPIGRASDAVPPFPVAER